jgi:hypothetical protein
MQQFKFNMINRVLSTALGCQVVIVVDAVEVSNYECYWHVGTARQKLLYAVLRQYR